MSLKHPIKAVCLDNHSLKVSQQAFQPLIDLFDEWQSYETTNYADTVTRLQSAQVAISNKVLLDKHVIEACPELKLILVTATGTNNIDLITAKAKGISVCNCQGYGTTAVTQHTMMLILALAGNLFNYNEVARNGDWQKASSFCLMNFPIMELADKTLGIIGYGELGKGVAKLANAFGMKVLVGQLPKRPKRKGAIPIDQLLPQVDILTLHCPLTQDTKNLITEKELRLMKPNALLINAARGGIVNEQDLANVLKNGHLGGAATDVLSEEPPKNGNPLLAPDIPRLIVTPHCAWATLEAQQRIIEQTIENVKAFLLGTPIRVIN